MIGPWPGGGQKCWWLEVIANLVCDLIIDTRHGRLSTTILAKNCLFSGERLRLASTIFETNEGCMLVVREVNWKLCLPLGHLLNYPLTRHYSGEQSTVEDKEELGQIADWFRTDLSLPLRSAESGSQADDVTEGFPAGLPARKCCFWPGTGPHVQVAPTPWGIRYSD